jgi:hypothetical protein
MFPLIIDIHCMCNRFAFYIAHVHCCVVFTTIHIHFHGLSLIFVDFSWILGIYFSLRYPPLPVTSYYVMLYDEWQLCLNDAFSSIVCRHEFVGVVSDHSCITIKKDLFQIFSFILNWCTGTKYTFIIAWYSGIKLRSD